MLNRLSYHIDELLREGKIDYDDYLTLREMSDQLGDENETLRKRLKDAVELPMIYEHITYPFFEDAYSKTTFYVVYKENGKIFNINCGKNREAAEAHLAELKGKKEKII